MLSEVVPRGPAPDGTDRAIAHISYEELVVGMANVLKHAMSLTEDALVAETARFFGYQRKGTAINLRLREVIRLAWEAGTIELKDRHYQLPSPKA